MAKFKVESGIQLLARLRRKPDIQQFYPNLFDCGPKCGETIEIFSKESTTWLLADIISEALMPANFGGVEASILIFNTDGNMNYDLLFDTLKKKLLLHIRKNTPKQNIHNEEELNIFLRVCLSNLHILEIYDATQFYTTLHNLESILSENSNISLIVFDTLTAFYWSEQGFKITKMDMYLKNLLSMIKKITKEYKLTILYTRPEYFRSSKDLVENTDCTDKHKQDQINYCINVTESGKESYCVDIKTGMKLIQKRINIDNNNLIKWL